MKNINNYIFEKFRISKDISEPKENIYIDEMIKIIQPNNEVDIETLKEALSNWLDGYNKKIYAYIDSIDYIRYQKVEDKIDKKIIYLSAISFKPHQDGIRSAEKDNNSSVFFKRNIDNGFGNVTRIIGTNKIISVSLTAGYSKILFEKSHI